MINTRTAKKADLRACEELFSSPELRTAKGEILPVDFLENYLEGSYFLVAESNSEIIGAMFGEELRGGGIILHEFSVKKEYQGKGVGGIMLDEFESRIKKNRGEWSLPYAPKINPDTLKFYENKGYSLGSEYVECLKYINN